MQCGNPVFHDEHDFVDSKGQSEMCIGNYEVVYTFGPWRVVLNPSGNGSGWLEAAPSSGLPYYPIDSGRIHSGEPDGHTWIDQVGEKVWAEPHMADFTLALRAAQERWPKMP